MLSVLFRAIQDKIHIINYVTGETVSKDLHEGSFIVNNLGRIPSLGLDSETESVFLNDRDEPNLEACRPALAGLEAEFGFPTMVEIEMNESCSLKCMTGEDKCYFHQYKADHGDENIFDALSLTEIENLFQDLIELGVFGVIFSGGDPFAHPRFERILGMATHFGLISEIRTPLRVYPSWFAQKSPYERMVGGVRTLLYSADPDIHDKMMHEEGAGAKALQGISEIKGSTYKIDVIAPQLDLNFLEFKGIRAFCESQNIPVKFIQATDTFYLENKKRANVGLGDQQRHYFCAEHENWLAYPDRQSKRSSSFRILTTGDVSSCTALPVIVGNLRQGLPSKLFQSTEARAGMPFFFESSLLQGMQYQSTPNSAKHVKGDSVSHR